MKLLHSIREILQSAGDILRLLWPTYARLYRLPANKYNGRYSAQSERLAQFP